MKYWENTIVAEDLLSVVTRESIRWDAFRGKTIAVTGATGLLGRLTTASLLLANKKYDLNMTVLAFVRNIQKAEAIFGEIKSDCLQYVEQDVIHPVSDSVHADYLIHGASVTTSKTMVEQPVETIWATVQGTKNMLDFAHKNKMQGMVFLSSMEVYGVCGTEKRSISEHDLGYIDVLNIRSSYPEGKRLAECMCASYAKEYDVPVKIARLSQIFGAGIDHNDNRACAQFARSVLAGKNIVLHTMGDKANCYCYTSDAVAALLTLLTEGENGAAYNVANMQTFSSIRELAETFIQVQNNGESELVIDIPEDAASLGYAPSSILYLNSEKMMALGWKPLVDLEDMVKRLLLGLDS